MPTTTITCDIRDSLGNPLAGFIRITLDYWLADAGRSYLTVPAQVTLVNGQTTLSLEPSEQAKVTYFFEIFQTGTPPTLIRSFRATVPESTTAINFNDLAQTTGITRDAQSSAIGAVTRRLYGLPDFWNAARTNLFPQKGTFNSLAFYKAGDVVFWNGSTYVCTSLLSIQGVLPNDTTRWQIWAAQGATGTGTLGNSDPYNSTSWNNATDAPSRGAIRNLVETTLATQAQVSAKADAIDGALTRAINTQDPPTFDSSSRIVSSAWVSTRVALIERAQCPIGSIISFAGLSAPTGWLICDGRAISRSLYSLLFGILGTTYGAGDGSTTFNIPDLRGRTTIAPDSSALQGAANRVPGANSGATGGASSVNLTQAQLPNNSLQVNLGTTPGGTAARFSGFLDNTGVASITTQNLGSGAPVSVLQPYLSVNSIIYTGVV